MPSTAMNQKMLSALTSGDVPDLFFADAPLSILPRNAWDDKTVDVSDVAKPFESRLSETAKLCSTFYNKATRRTPSNSGAMRMPMWS
jgi:multiple sugar transport system substrate-binding protein